MTIFPASFLAKVKSLNYFRCEWAPRTWVFIKHNPNAKILDRDPEEDEILTEIDALSRYVKVYQQQGEICKSDPQLTYHLKRGPFASLLNDEIPFADLETTCDIYIKALDDFFKQADQFNQDSPQLINKEKKGWEVARLLRLEEGKIMKLTKSRIETPEEREQRVAAGKEKYATLLASEASPKEIAKALYPEIFDD